jgi:Cu(I)/Ag(I) efflux system membrane fusion protein
MRSLDVLEDEIARLRKTGKAQRRIAVRAPADGVVIEKPAQEGMRIEAGQPLYKRRIYPISGSSPRCRSRNLGLVHPARAPKRGSRAGASCCSMLDQEWNCRPRSAPS